MPAPPSAAARGTSSLPGQRRPRRSARVALAVALAAAQLAAVPLHAQTLTPARPLPGLGDGAEMSTGTERELGDRIARELYRDPDFVDDPVLADYVQGIWQPLLAAARQRGELTPELDERFAWVLLIGRDRSINAFALPGGYLGVNTGLIAIVGSRDELASVLAHELTHVTQRHISRMLTQQSRQMPLMLAAMLLGGLAMSKSGRSGGDLGSAMMVGGQAMAMQKQLDFSRDMEREADRIGFGVMSQAGFAPQGAAVMFEKLQYASRLNDNGSYPYLRSHPLTSERITEMQARVQFREGAPPPTVALTPEHAMIAARARVLGRPGVDLLRQWVQAAQGSTAPASAATAGTLYAGAMAAKELRDLPAARSLAQKLRTQVGTAGEPARLARLLAAEIEMGAGNAPAAVALLDVRAKTRGEMLMAGQAALLTRTHAAEAAPVLRDWVATHPRDATVWRLLGGLYDVEGDTLRAIRAEAEAQVAQLDYVAARDRFRAAQDYVRETTAKGGRVDHIEASIVDVRAREIERLAREQMEEKPM